MVAWSHARVKPVDEREAAPRKPGKMWEEMRRVIPAMKERGGYIASSDHSVPESVSLEDFRRFVELAKKLGSYA